MQTTVFLRPLVLPGYLDAYPVIIDRKGNSLIVSDKTEWAEPFRDAVARVLRDALSRQLGDSRVLIEGDGRIPDADLTVEFLALDPQHGALRLDAKWSFSCTARDRPSHGGSTSFEIPLEAATAPAVAAATAHALGRLADVLAAQAECVTTTSRNDTPIMGIPIPQATYFRAQPGSSSVLGATVCLQGANFSGFSKRGTQLGLMFFERVGGADHSRADEEPNVPLLADLHARCCGRPNTWQSRILAISSVDTGHRLIN